MLEIKDLRHKISRKPMRGDEPRTVAELFYHTQKHHNRKNALSYKRNGEWKSISTDDLIGKAEAISRGLHSLGIKRGDRISILASNSPEWTIIDAACQISGVIDVPIYTTLTPGSVEYILRDSGSRVIFLENAESYERLADVLESSDGLEKIVFIEPSPNDISNSLSLDELVELGQQNSEIDIAGGISKIESGAIATLIYTSGTTGEPKGVMLTHENLMSNVIDVGVNFDFDENDIPLSVLPLSHVFERTGMYVYIYNGMAIHYAESIEKVAENLLEVRPTVFVGVPRVFEKVYARAKLIAAASSPLKERIFDWAIEIGKEAALLKEKGMKPSGSLALKYKIADKIVFSKLREFFGGRLQSCITGGAALSDSIYLIFTGAGISIFQGYGLTETSPVLTTNTPDNTRLGTVGKPIPNVRIRIADDGEIEAAGPGIMLGYYNKPEATRDAFTEDGWFKTGDIGELTDDGFLKITDRKKELFKTSGGKYIAPSPIEQMIKGSRYVSQVVLIGNSRKFAAALIVPDFEQLRGYAKSKNLGVKTPNEFCSHEGVLRLFEKEIDKLCTGLARFETVKKIALLEDELTVEGGELTPTLKIKRRVIDEKYKPIIDEIYEEN